jgi:hypothetical protein
MLSRFVRMRQALWTYSYWHRSAASFYPGEDRRRESVVAGGAEAVIDHGTGFICGDVQAGDLPLGVGVDAGGDQTCTSPPSRPRTRSG